MSNKFLVLFFFDNVLNKFLVLDYYYYLSKFFAEHRTVGRSKSDQVSPASVCENLNQCLVIRLVLPRNGLLENPSVILYDLVIDLWSFIPCSVQISEQNLFI